MEKQETEMKWKLEMEMGRKNAPITGVMFSITVCLVITLVAMVLGVAFWVLCFAFTPVLYFVITAFSSAHAAI